VQNLIAVWLNGTSIGARRSARKWQISRPAFQGQSGSSNRRGTYDLGLPLEINRNNRIGHALTHSNRPIISEICRKSQFLYSLYFTPPLRVLPSECLYVILVFVHKRRNGVCILTLIKKIIMTALPHGEKTLTILTNLSYNSSIGQTDRNLILISCDRLVYSSTRLSTLSTAFTNHGIAFYVAISGEKATIRTNCMWIKYCCSFKNCFRILSFDEAATMPI